jgi:hypothetical protein
MCRVLLLLALIQSLIASQAKEGTKYLIGVGKSCGYVIEIRSVSLESLSDRRSKFSIRRKS